MGRKGREEEEEEKEEEEEEGGGRDRKRRRLRASEWKGMGRKKGTVRGEVLLTEADKKGEHRVL
ncbi:hypothetical protein E2C01_016033 [Portunus trituberculatus]|uniref:Uncharacterized protein n=1 Tax=Portunus trituberculatus TaxID=210409 RepID=A0A5B7DND9_PORTR|nr:hypothetical protein [Portunus trituberculatus]